MRVTCEITQSGSFVRAVIGPGSDQSIQDCYRSLAVRCIQDNVRRALVIGDDGEPEAHFALREGLRCAALAGLPPGFMLAMVAPSAPLLGVYREAEKVAREVGIEAKAFAAEHEAISWLLGTAP